MDRELSAAAIHPDGTVYVVETSDDTASLLALDGDTGGIRARWPLGASGRQYANATAPVIRQDGTVAVLAHRWKTYWQYEMPQTVLFEANSETLVISEQEVNTDGLSTQDRSPLHWNDVSRIVPDGQDGLLLLVSDLGAVYRVAPDRTLSNPLYLRGDPFYYAHPPLAPQIVVGDGIAYALVQSRPYDLQGKAPGPRSVVAFDPVTLQPLLTTPLPHDNEQYLLHSISASDAAIVTGPEWGNLQEIGPGYWSFVEPSAGIRIDNSNGIEEGPSPYWDGNEQGGRAAVRPNVIFFIEPRLLAETYFSETYQNDVQTQIAGDHADLLASYFREEKATADNFLNAVNTPTDLVAFFGDSIWGPDGQGQLTSYGLRLRQKSVVKRWDPQPADPLDDQLPQKDWTHTKIVDRIESRARIIFVAACTVGPAFMGLWAIDDATPDRVMIVPQDIHAVTNLKDAALTWLDALVYRTNESRRTGRRVSVAWIVYHMNTYLQSKGLPLRFKAIGGNRGNNVYF